MKINVLAVVILLTSLSFAGPLSEKTKLAVEHLSDCGNFLRADNQFVYTGFGPYFTGHENIRKPQPSVLKFIDINTLSENVVVTADSSVDAISYNGLTYILTYNGLEEWNLRAGKRLAIYRTHTEVEGGFQNEQHPQGMALYQDKLVIAHGRLGTSIFNLTTKKITRTIPLTSQGVLESMAQGVAVSGQLAFVVVDSYSLVGEHEKPAFRGLVVIDLAAEKVVREIDDLPPGLDSITSDSKSVVLSFYGMPLWKFSVNALVKNKKVQPTSRVFKFPMDGTPKGKAFMDDKYYYTCFSQLLTEGQHSHYIKTKAVLNRQQLMLD